MAKILCVEDEPGLREDLVETLELAGHTVIEAANGALGLAAILAEKPDLTISDVTMPEMNGHDLLLVLRETHPEFAEMPFVFLSALADRKDQIAGHKLGADDYLTKPVDFEIMHVVIDAKLQQVARMRAQKDRQLLKLYGALTGVPVFNAAHTRRVLSGPEAMTTVCVSNDEIDLGEAHAMIEAQGHALFRLNSGREFLDTADQLAPDVLLISFNTIDLQAPMLVKMLSAKGSYPFPKVLLMPPSIPDLPDGGLMPGFDAQLRAPIDREVLLQQIESFGRGLMPAENLLAVS